VEGLRVRSGRARTPVAPFVYLFIQVQTCAADE
jgi:hypothetical protein